MRYSLVTFLLLTLFFSTCIFGQHNMVKNVGSMVNMGKENFASHIQLDTIQVKKNLFGMGPLGKMQGEITIFDGKPLGVSVDEHGEGIVSTSWKVASPFFVYANVEKWQSFPFEGNFKSLENLQKYVAEVAQKNGFDLNKPFPFRIAGTFDKITTHIVMPRSEDIKGFQAGKKQADYDLIKPIGELLGFYSQNHQGTYTPNNSLIHVHFISNDQTVMGHLDKIDLAKNSLTLLLPQTVQPESVSMQVNDTDFSKGRLGNMQIIDLKDLTKFHGHLCDGLAEGFLALKGALFTLFPDSIIDRTNVRIVSKPSPCLTDAAIYMTGGRYQFNTFYVSSEIKSMYIVQRIDNGKTVSVSRKANIKPSIIDKMGNQATENKLSACELDTLRMEEDKYTRFLLLTNPNDIFEIQVMNDFKWKPILKNTFKKTDVLNKNMSQCKE
ncbi:MAG: acetolactate decarboxylase [Bacteroidota bacterium]